MIWNSTSRLLHPPGTEGKEKQANRLWKRESKELRGWLEDLWGIANADTKKGSVFPLLGLLSLHRAIHPNSAGNPHTSAHQKDFIFPFRNTDIRSGSLPLDKSLMTIMPQKRPRSKLHIHVYWDQTLLSPTLSILHLLKCSCASKKPSNS